MTKANLPVIMRATSLSGTSDRRGQWAAVSAFSGITLPGNLYQLMIKAQVTA